MTKETKTSRRNILRGALTASAAAAAVVIGGREAWSQTDAMMKPKSRLPAVRPQIQPRQIKQFNFRHSRFSGRATRLAPMANIDTLIGRIAQQTNLKPEQVHQVLAMAYPSTEQFVLRKYAANPEALNRNLALAGRGAAVAIVAPV